MPRRTALDLALLVVLAPGMAAVTAALVAVDIVSTLRDLARLERHGVGWGSR